MFFNSNNFNIYYHHVLLLKSHSKIIQVFLINLNLGKNQIFGEILFLNGLFLGIKNRRK